MKECLKEVDRPQKEESRWRKERRMYYERNGYSASGIGMYVTEGKIFLKHLINRDKEVQQQIIYNKIEASRCCKNYKQLTIEKDRAKYLWKKGKKDSQEIIARFRCGCEELQNKYWLEEIEKMCRICKREPENLFHLKTSCAEEIKSEETIWSILHEDGRGEKWMRRVIMERSK